MTSDQYEYGKAYPITDGEESGDRISFPSDGLKRYIRRVSKAEFDQHKPDGYLANGKPYWNYLRVQRPISPKWRLVE